MREAEGVGWLRWTGVAGAALLAFGGVFAGALPGPAPSRAEALWGTGTGFRLGLLGYVLGLVLLGWVWWRLGARLRRPDGPSLRWVLTTGGLWALPLLVAPPLASRDLYAYACQGAVWLDGFDPYAVGAAAGGCPWVESVPELWRDGPAPYGPVALLGSAAAVLLARAVATGESAQLVVALGGLRAVALAGAVLLAWAGPRLARAGGVDPAVAAWLGLVTPLVAVHVVGGGHNDALVAGLVVAGLALAADRRRLPVVLAGVALGLAVAVKVTALAAVPFAAILAVGWRRGPTAAGTLLTAAAASFAGVTVATGLGTGWTAALADTGALVQWTSPPTGVGMTVGYLLRGLGAPAAYDPAVAVARGFGLALLLVVGVAALWFAWRRRSDPRAVVLGCGAVLAATVLLGPVVYPWYAVVPLAVLAAAVSGESVRRWLAGATLVLTGLVLPSGLGLAVLTKGPGAVLMTVAVLLVSGWGLRRWRRRRRGAAPVPESARPATRGAPPPTDRPPGPPGPGG